MKYIKNSHTLKDFNKIIKIYILFSIFYLIALFHNYIPFSNTNLLIWICTQNFSVLLTFFALFLIIYVSFFL